VPLTHGVGQQGAPESSGQTRGYRIREKEPGVSTLTGTGTLKGYGDVEDTADVPDRGCVLLPPLLVKVDRQKMAGFILEQRVNTGNNYAPQVGIDDILIQGSIGSVGAGGTLDLELSAEIRFPFVLTGRCEPSPGAILAFPPFCIYVLPSFEQRHEEANFFRWISLGGDKRA